MDYLNETINQAIEAYKDKLNSAVDFAKSEFANVRAGRVSSSIVENVTIDAYDTKMRIAELATVTNEDARTLVINAWDVALRPEIARVLAKENLGANPIDNGQNIRMIFPALTEERRKELVKQVKVLAENARVTMRNERRDVIDKVRKTAKTDKFSEDEIKNIETDIQKVLDDYIKNLDTFLERKEKEILEI